MKTLTAFTKKKIVTGSIALLFALVMSPVVTIAQKKAAPTKTPTDAPKGALTAKAPAASNYVWTTPVTGMPTIPVWTRGATYHLTWTGGPAGPVKLYLINWCTWTTEYVIIASTPNTHNYTWTVPATLPCGVFECYIQNAVGAPANWSYSMNFALTKP